MGKAGMEQLFKFYSTAKMCSYQLLTTRILGFLLLKLLCIKMYIIF